MRGGEQARAALVCGLTLMLAGGTVMAASETTVSQALNALYARGLLLDTQRLEQAAGRVGRG